MKTRNKNILLIVLGILLILTGLGLATPAVLIMGLKLTQKAELPISFMLVGMAILMVGSGLTARYLSKIKNEKAIRSHLKSNYQNLSYYTSDKVVEDLDFENTEIRKLLKSEEGREEVQDKINKTVERVNVLRFDRYISYMRPYEREGVKTPSYFWRLPNEIIDKIASLSREETKNSNEKFNKLIK